MNSVRVAFQAAGRGSTRAAPAAVLLGLLWAAAPTSAQIGIDPADVITSIITDGSFGDATSVVGDAGIFEITESLGSRPGGENGQNLFHSFEQFDLATPDTARFSAIYPTNNVISRVTGGDVSEIFGTIESAEGLGEANFYFLNPNGVVFGPDAHLNVKGSFYVSTADELGFDGGEVFAAQRNGEVPTVAMANPVDFGFWIDDAAPATIWFDQTRASTLDPNFMVDAGKTLSVVAGRVEMVGPGNETRPNVGAEGGVIQIAAAPAGSRIPIVLSELEDIESLRSDDALVLFTSGGGARVAGSGPDAPAQIVIRAGRFEMERQQLDAVSGILEAEGTGREAEGSNAIDVEVAGKITLVSGEVVSTTFVDESSGDIRLAGDEVELATGSIVLGRILDGGSGPGPGILVDANGRVSIRSGSQLGTQDEVKTGNSTGKIGDIAVNAAEVIVTGSGSAIFTTSRGLGDGAVVHVEADYVEVSDLGEIRAQRFQKFGEGFPDDPGRVEVIADELLVSDGAIASVTEGFGSGADVYVRANTIAVQGTGDPNRTAQITTITRPGEVQLDSGQILTRFPDGRRIEGGRGGDLTIEAGSEAQAGLVTLDNGGQIRAVTTGSANAGDLMLTVVGGSLITSGVSQRMSPNGELEAAPSGVFGRSEQFRGDDPPDSNGDGGQLQILANSVIVENGAEISARTETDGNAGDLTIIAKNLVSVRGVSDAGLPSTISARGAGGSFDEMSGDPRPGNGGHLMIDTDVLEVVGGGQVSASASGSGDAKDVTITARDILVSGEGSGVFAQALGRSVFAGRAGDLILMPHEGERMTLRVLDGGELSVQADEFGAPGDIDIRGADLVEIAGGGSINASVERIILRRGETADDLPDLASDIRIADTDQLVLSGGTITAETVGSARGGTIEIVANDILLESGSSITSRSSSTAIGSGSAGNIALSAEGSFEARGSSITTTAQADDAGGGRISIQAGDRVYLLDSTVETTVLGSNAGADAGDIFIPLPQEAPAPLGFAEGGALGVVDPVVPKFVVINRSIVRANAIASGAGDITIDGSNVLISSDSVIEAHSEQGVSGAIQISAPDADIVSQVAPLAANFVDPSDRLLPPCVARTERTGSFVVQNHEALPRSLDAPLPPNLVGAPGADGIPPASGSTECSVFQERS